MDEKELLELIKRKETENVEFKPSLSQVNEIVETVSAFSNTSGGRILVGISNSGKLLDVNIGKDTIERLTNKIVSNAEPKVYPNISVKGINKKDIIVIEVKKSSDVVLAFGRAFKRVGKSTVRMSKDEYEKTILERKRVYFDSQIYKGATLKDIDGKKVKWFLRKSKTERKFDIDLETPIKEVLEKLNLITDKELTNAAILIFGKNPQKFFLHSRIRCARFKGIEPLDFIDMKVFEGTIPELRENAMKFIMQHIKHAVYFDANRRYDKWEYPLRALEEALTNALAHRDYFSDAEVQLSIFDDRIEIWNPGELPKPLKPEDLKRKHKSIPRNKLIADMLFLIKYIERWGTGTNRMIDEMKENGLEEPQFQNISGGFEVTLFGPGAEFEKKIEMEKIHKIEINERQTKALDYIKKHGRISNKEYVIINNVSRITATRELMDLVKKKLLKQRGVGRGSFFIANV